MKNNILTKQVARQGSGLFPIAFGVMLALAELIYLAPDKRIDFDKFGIGFNSESVFGVVDGYAIHCQTPKSSRPCIDAVQANKQMRQVLWLGASQLHSVNYFQPGDRTAVMRLHDRLLPQGYFTTSYSMGNSNFQELYVTFEFVRKHFDLEVLVLGAVFDDMREAGVRGGVANAFTSPNVAEIISKTSVGRTILDHWKASRRNRVSNVGAISDPDKEESYSTQNRTEAFLNEMLNGTFNVWAARSDLRGFLVVRLNQLMPFLTDIRNTIFGINPKRIVSIDKSQYIINRNALEAILESAQQAKIAVLLYIVPRPVGAYFPYNPEEYSTFKSDVAELAGRYGVGFVNLEDAVVGDVWGTMKRANGNIVLDHFHFMASGHKQLEAAVAKALTPVLSKGPKK